MAEHVARAIKQRNAYKVLVGISERKSQELNADGRIILKRP